MSGRKWYEWLLTIVYLFMIVVCLYLNLFGGEELNLTNLVVNIAMFVIVGIIFLSCDVTAFLPTNRMIRELKRATERIASDAAESDELLWNRYSQGQEPLFFEGRLKERYLDFARETERIAKQGGLQYRCDLEDFINLDLVDETLHRNLLNQVPGALTGLGILGTFIGLSLGLEGFSTGSAAEITGSIAPLMSGIKVAFHTSIYGMIFSLIFNYVFKRKAEEAEFAVEDFLTAHRNFVLPDAEADGRNLVLRLLKDQADSLRDLTENISESLADSMDELLEPQFDRFDKTLSDFAEGAHKNQLDALGVIVNGFIAEMNKSLNNSFSQLSYTIDRTFKLQQNNADQLQLVLEGTARQSARYTEWLSDQERLIKSLSEEIEKMPESAAATVRSLQESMTRSDAQFKSMVRELETVTEQLPYTYSAAYDGVRDALGEVKRSIERLNDSLTATIERIEAAAERTQGRERSSALFGRK